MGNHYFHCKNENSFAYGTVFPRRPEMEILASLAHVCSFDDLEIAMKNKPISMKEFLEILTPLLMRDETDKVGKGRNTHGSQRGKIAFAVQAVDLFKLLDSTGDGYIFWKDFTS